MNLIQLKNGHKAYGSKALFEDATFAVNDEEHIGVIGPNGAGKTTLFRILLDEEHLDSGEIVRSRGLRVGYLAQEVEWATDETPEDYLSKCVTPIWELKSLGHDLGLSEEMFAAPIRSLSGGYRMRCKLLYLIGMEPNLMLLDEPTNYLDLETLLVLEHFLQGYRGAFLLISHDREFLRRTTDHTLEIESGEITKFPGNIDDYFEEKALLREQLETRALTASAKRKEILDFAARFGAKATKARQAQSRLKLLKKMEVIEVKPLPVSAKIKIPEPVRIGKTAVTLDRVNLGYGDRTVLKDVELKLLRGDKVAVVGYNGVGKSTLLKGIGRVLEPQKGSVQYGMDVDCGYYAQHVSEELDLKSTVLQELERSAHKHVTRQEVLDVAGSLLFSGDFVQKRISTLSGGEKARVALGKILLRKVPLLILDEATNHLDFGTVEALTQSLKAYQGTLVLVSHDRGFIRRVAEKIFEIRDGRVYQFHGTYDEYVWSLEKGALSQVESSAPTKAAPTPKAPPPKAAVPVPAPVHEKRKADQRQVRELEKSSKELERKIAAAQKRIEELAAILPAQSGAEREATLKELGGLPHDLVELEEKWMRVLEELEAART